MHRNLRKSSCPQGHPYDEKNTAYRQDKRNGGKYRACKCCEKIRKRVARRRKRQEERKARAKQHRPKALAQIDKLWASTLALPECRYKSAMLEAKQEFDQWLEDERKKRQAKKGQAKGKAIICGGKNGM